MDTRNHSLSSLRVSPLSRPTWRNRTRTLMNYFRRAHRNSRRVNTLFESSLVLAQLVLLVVLHGVRNWQMCGERTWPPGDGLWKVVLRKPLLRMIDWFRHRLSVDVDRGAIVSLSLGRNDEKTAGYNLLADTRLWAMDEKFARKIIYTQVSIIVM